MAETKQCPECAEQVLAAARMCRFCGYRFDRGGGNWLAGLLPVDVRVNAATIAPGMATSFGRTRATMSLAACPLAVLPEMGFKGANTRP